MIKYGDLVQYIKENHINWNTDLFDVLRGFFESYNNKYYSPPTPSNIPIQQEIFFPLEEFKEPDDGEYTNQDLLNLFST